MNSSIVILGVPFDHVTTQETLALIQQMVASGQPHYLATANVDFLVQARSDIELRRILFDAPLVLCDGTPLLWASRLLGNPLPERVAGSDLVPLLLQVAAEKGYRLFFLGGTPESTARAVENVRRQFPTIQVSGHFSPPFGKLLEFDQEEINRRIREARPDLLLVAFGCPKAEKWMAMNYQKIGVPVSVGIGATIDFLAGQVSRAPRWMRCSGTEWIYRLLQEPRRLLGRYAKDVFVFSWAFAVQLWRLQLRGTRKHRPSSPPALARTLGQQRLRLPARVDCAAVNENSAMWERTFAGGEHALVELQDVTFIDSTGVGLLVRLQKRARALGSKLVLVAPSSVVLRDLEVLRLKDFFVIHPDLQSAEAWLRQHPQSAPVLVPTSPSHNEPALLWQDEITAANADEVWRLSQGVVASWAPNPAPLLIDLGKVRFVDSTGIGIMIRMKKLARRHGCRLQFQGAQANVLNVIRLSGLEAFLLEGRL